MDAGETTLVLQRIERGEEPAADQLLALVYQDLRRLAKARMAYEAPGQTLQPTALVHEAWLRLGADQQPAWQNRAQFFSAAAEAMRRILIDRARRRLAQRRGGRVERVNIDDLEVAEVAVIGVPDDKWGEVVKALVVLAPGATVGERELIHHCRDRIAHYKCPRSVEFRPDLARTATGKLQKFKLRAPYWEGLTRLVN